MRNEGVWRRRGAVGRGASRRRRVRRDGGIPPAGPCAAAWFPGRCKHRPLHGFATPQGCSFPFGRAFAAVRRGGPWPSREPLRRRNFPVYRRVFPGSVGRAFTPAAPRQFQNRNVRAAAGSGGMRASRPTAARVAAAVPVGPKHKFIRRGGIYCARRRVSEANRRAAAALRPEIPSAGPCAAARFPGRCEHRPLHGFAMPQGCGFPFGRAPCRRS